MVIGIGGVSRAGKTTLSRNLSQLIQSYHIVIHLDDFSKTLPNNKMIFDKIDWEHPSSIDFNDFYNEIMKAKSVYNIVIIEGFLISYDIFIKKLIDRYFHIVISKETFMERRLKDYSEPQWYLEHVWQNYEKYGQEFDDLYYKIIDGEKPIDYSLLIEFVNLN